MEILLITSDTLLRDQIKVGLQQFPEFRVTCGENFSGVNMLRSAAFDHVFLELGNTPQDSLTLLKHLRSFDRETDAVALADARTIKDLGREKQRYGLTAFLHSPLDPNEFFKLVARIRARHADNKRSERKNPDYQKV